MKIRFDKYGYGYCKHQKAYELNIIIGKFQLRIGQFEFAMWWNYNPLFMFLRPLHKEYWN